MTGKMPAALLNAIAARKQILILINPPYAEAANSQGNQGKTNVASTKIGALMRNEELGYAARGLFVQFMMRISKEIPMRHWRCSAH